MQATIYHHLATAESLDAWQPLDGHMIVTCKIRILSGGYDAWETRTYEFRRSDLGTWIVYTDPGIRVCDSWDGVVDWFCHMRPIEIDLVTTV